MRQKIFLSIAFLLAGIAISCTAGTSGPTSPVSTAQISDSRLSKVINFGYLENGAYRFNDQGATCWFVVYGSSNPIVPDCIPENQLQK